MEGRAHGRSRPARRTQTQAGAQGDRPYGGQDHHASVDTTYRGFVAVTVLPEYRGRGLGVELAREAVDNGRHASLRWILHPKAMHRLYARFGFVTPGERCMERPPGG